VSTPPVSGGTKDEPYTVEQAIDIQDASDAWVEGYIVGYITGSDAVSRVEADFDNYNLAIASTAGETDIANMIFVQLKDDARTQLGLGATTAAGSSTLDKKVKLNGSLENYYGKPGLKGVSTVDQFEILE